MPPATKTPTPPYAFDLKPRQAQRVWEQAVRARMTVTLTPRTDESLQLVGRLHSRTGESFWIELDQAAADDTPALQSVCCDGEIDLAGCRYLFHTNVLAARVDDDPGGPGLIEIARPDVLQVLQRRRFVRAEVQESAPVQLSRGVEGGGRTAAWSSTACLLNLSLDGLACRLERAAADGVGVGQVVQTSFALDGAPEPFALDAVIKSKIPAGTEGLVVMGLHLLYANDGQYERLQSVLEQTDWSPRSSRP